MMFPKVNTTNTGLNGRKNVFPAFSAQFVEFCPAPTSAEDSFIKGIEIRVLL
jgi:hypothetical protein